ncbi:hypothetical protein [Kordia zhangzhouensis]|uniref:hypothetical protein n=1 Tax=Kordia zhangzhouensis TaxID=1620405 RepID=UPI0012E0B39D|nr:hypothetical protein [Kordia zhangzhouensis]
MKKSSKKISLKKHSISLLQTNKVKGGTGTTSLITVTCRSFIYNGEDNCVSNQQ